MSSPQQAQKHRVKHKENGVFANFCNELKCVKTVFHRELPQDAKVAGMRIKRTPTGKYFVIFTVKFEVPFVQKEAFTLNDIVGIDIGVSDMIIDSNGKKVEPPRFLVKGEALTRRASRDISRKREVHKKQKTDFRESKRYQKAKTRLTKAHEAIKNKRKNFTHELSFYFANLAPCIVLEDIKLSFMTRNGKLNKGNRIADMAIGSFREKLKYKVHQYGGKVILVNQLEFPSSQLCSSCGAHDGKKALSVREWACEKCGEIHDRDTNAAVNLKQYGAIQLGLMQDIYDISTLKKRCKAAAKAKKEAKEAAKNRV